MTIKLKPLTARLLASGSILMSLMLPTTASADNAATQSTAPRMAGNSTLVAFLSTSSIDADITKAIRIHNDARTREEHDVAVNLLLQASAKGSAEAKFRLASMYLDCEYVSNDEEEVLILLGQAAKKGHKQAIFLQEILLNSDFTIGC